MKFIETKIKGVFLIELEKKVDERGFLARTWGVGEFKERRIDFNILQGYVTRSLKKGTMRGFHYLKVAEQKLTRVVRGAVYEVVIDIRPKSKTFKKWQAFALKDTDYKMLYMGAGIAHAILTLSDNTELMSLYSPVFVPGNEGGIRYNDPGFNIDWPIEVKHVSKKDLSWEDFKDIKNQI
jgi:dTDP-4-dehydrorhamnose 3,5-epimerase